MIAKFALLMMAVGLQDTEARPVWKTFVSREAGFTAEMPGKPEEMGAPAESPVGMYSFVANDGDVVYSVFVQKIEAPLPIPKEATKTFLDHFRDSTVAGMTGELAGEKEIKIGDHQGREIRVKKREGLEGIPLLCTIRFYLVGDSTYTQMVIAPKGRAVATGRDRFFRSFRLGTPKEAGAQKKAGAAPKARPGPEKARPPR